MQAHRQAGDKNRHIAKRAGGEADQHSQHVEGIIATSVIREEELPRLIECERSRFDHGLAGNHMGQERAGAP